MLIVEIQLAHSYVPVISDIQGMVCPASKSTSANSGLTIVPKDVLTVLILLVPSSAPVQRDIVRPLD